jgi:hypothetical protein
MSSYRVIETVNLPIVSEVLALKLRRQESERPYIYVQIFAAISYVVASMFMLVLRWINKKQYRP